MSDEWSTPVKTGDEWESERLGSAYGYKRVGVADDVRIDTDLASSTAPRDVVLRLLAAEASDRLGWVWEVVADVEEPAAYTTDYWRGSWCVTKDGIRWFGNDAGDGFDADKLLAFQHGRFLLADALREAGQ